MGKVGETWGRLNTLAPQCPCWIRHVCAALRERLAAHYKTAALPLSYASFGPSFADLAETVNRRLVPSARDCARELPGGLLQVGIGHDRPMKKSLFNRENVEKVVRLVPRPMMNGKLIARSRNSWLIVEEYGEGDGIVVLNKITNHGGEIPYDSIRKWQEPDVVILSCQVNVGKDGLFELHQFLDGPETEMLTEEEEILPERLNFVETGLRQCPEEYIPVLKELLIRGSMEQGEIDSFCARNNIQMSHKFFPKLSGTSFLELGARQNVWIKPVFVHILEKLLLKSKTDTDITPPQPPQLS